jgi:hypothetical protein
MDINTITKGRVAPWNKGKLLDQKPPLNLNEILAIRIRLQLDHRAQELALLNLAIDSKLRGCHLVGLRVHDVVQGSQVAARAIVMQKKPVQFEMIEQRRDAVGAWPSAARLKPEQFIFPSRLSGQPTYRPAAIPDRRIVGWHRLGLTRRPTAPIQCGAQSRR